MIHILYPTIVRIEHIKYYLMLIMIEIFFFSKPNEMQTFIKLF